MLLYQNTNESQFPLQNSNSNPNPKMQPKFKRPENRRLSAIPTTTPSPSPLTSNPLLHSQQRFTRTHLHPLSLFPVGSEVEVTSNEEGLRGAWFLATVVNPPPLSSSSNKQQHQQQQQQKLFVEYKNLANTTGSGPLREFVDLAFVRPKPPIDSQNELPFKVNDVVDAFFNHGWWTGLVTEVVSFGDTIHKSRSYRVSFSDPPREMDFEPSELRIHKYWVDGKWVVSDKKRPGELNFTPGTTVEVNIHTDNSQDIWFPATCIENKSDGSFLVEYHSSRELGPVKMVVDSLHIRPSPPQISRKTFNLLEKVDAFFDNRWVSGVVTKILADGRYIVYFKRTKKEKELCHSDIRLHMEWTKGKWLHPSQDILLSPNYEKLGRAINSGYPRIHVPPVCTGFMKDNDGEETLSTLYMKSCQKLRQTSGNDDASNDPLSSEPCNVKMKQTEGSNNGTQAVFDTVTPSNRTRSNSKESEESDQRSASTENKGDDMKHSSRRKRGRPPRKLQVVSDADAEAQNRNDVVSPFESLVGCLGQNEKEDGNPHTDKSSDHENVEPEKENDDTNLKKKRGRPAKGSYLDDSPKSKESEDSTDEYTPGTGTAEPVGTSDSPPSSRLRKRPVRLLNNQIKHQNTRGPIRRSFVKRRKGLKEIIRDKEDKNERLRHVLMRRGRQQKSEPLTKDAVDDTRDTEVDEVVENGTAKDVEPVGEQDQGTKQLVDQPKEKAQEKKDAETPVDYTGHDDNAPHRLDKTPMESTEIVSTNNEVLPFVKNSSIWKMLESMEVFKHLPQNPHFRPLYNCKEEYREGLAIGNMVTFTTVVDKVSRLELSDPRSLLEGNLEALIDLEQMGFNVEPVRDRLNTLLAVKVRYEQAQNTCQEIEGQIKEQNLEKSKIDEEIIELEKKIAELEEKRRLVVSKKEVKDSEIGLLQDSMDAVKGSIESAKQQFERVSALW